MNHFLSANNVKDIKALVEQALYIKQNPNVHCQFGQHKTIVLLFFNPSLRTRISTQKAAYNLGMNVITLNAINGWKLEFEDGSIMNLDKAEHIKEAAAVISQYADIIGVRSFPGLKDKIHDYQDTILSKFAQYATVPVINMESSTVHPLQSLTDAITIEAFKKKPRPKVVLSWAPHPRALPQAVPNSFVEWIKRINCELVITHPEGYELAPKYTQNCTIEYDQNKAFKDADFIYAKNWSSYSSYGQILSTDQQWMISQKKMALTNEAYFMHCLPVRRNVVVEDAVIDSPQSLVIQQAANREFAAQAVLMALLESSNLKHNIHEEAKYY